MVSRKCSTIIAGMLSASLTYRLDSAGDMVDMSPFIYFHLLFSRARKQVTYATTIGPLASSNAAISSRKLTMTSVQTVPNFRGIGRGCARDQEAHRSKLGWTCQWQSIAPEGQYWLHLPKATETRPVVMPSLYTKKSHPVIKVYNHRAHKGSKGAIGVFICDCPVVSACESSGT